MLNKMKDFFAGYSASGPIEAIVVGLGNPGKQYEQTRHNAGFLAVDYLVEKLGMKLTKLKFQSLCGDAVLGGKKVLFLKPTTFMNRSGEAVRDAMAFYKIPPENVVILSDDASLPVGGMRIRRGGSDGGQKGIRSIITLTGKDTFPRIRMGIGHKPHPEMDMADWVLSRFSAGELKALAGLFPNVMAALELMVCGGIEQAMGRYNTRGIGKDGEGPAEK